MTEAQQMMDQFTFWNNSLASSIQETTRILKTTDYNISDLQEALKGLNIDLDHVLKYQTHGRT